MTLISHTSKPEAQAPQWAVELPSQMPAEVYGGTTDDGARVPGLYDLLLAHPDKWAEINERVLGQAGGGTIAGVKAMRTLEEAEGEARRSMQIDSLRAEVFNAIHEIRQQALKAAANIARLEAPEVYDVDTAESPDMAYVKSFIEDIRKAGIAAYAILPFDENGDSK